MIRKINTVAVITAGCLLIPFFANAQYKPAAYNTNIPLNSIKIYEPSMPMSTVTEVQHSSRTVEEVKIATQYFDGLGRPLQTVSWRMSPAKKDMVAPQVYDEYGREVYKFLPYIHNVSGSNNDDGKFKYDPFEAQRLFMNTMFGSQGETYFYNKTNLEASPLSRPEKSMAPGNSWVGNNKGVESKYWINTSTDDVRKWIVINGTTGGFATYSTSAAYPAGTLYKNAMVDEHGKQVIEFKDKEGKVLLKKVQLTATADAGTGADYTGWLSTYYIYDDLNNLRCVVQPEAVKLLPGSGWNLSTAMLDEQCFRYEYDYRNRMHMKKVPGAGAVNMVYDTRDRLVMTQDAKLAASDKWMVTLYDDLNRPVQTGLLLNTYWGTSGKTVQQHQTDANGSSAYPFAISSPPSASYWELLTETHYDDYNNLPAGLSATLNSGAVNSSNFILPYNVSPYYAQPLVQSTQVKGMPAWTKVKVLGTTTWLSSVTIYDDKGRAIQVQSINITGGLDIVTTQYDFSGKVLKTHTRHEKQGANAALYETATAMVYDHAGRVTDIKKKQPSAYNTEAEKTIATMTYDELGQLKTKKLAPAYNSNAGLETETFDYNIRGWMLGMNRSYLTSAGQNGTTKFGFELGYDKITSQSGRNFQGAGLFNGNITGMVWKSDGDDVRRKYDFSYDAANRLLQGLFEQDDAASTWNNTTMNYTAKMGDGADANSAYDYNGNIKAMTQFGWKLGVASTTPVDNMRYTYITGSNKLKSVTDFNNDALTKLGDFKTNTTHPQNTAKAALTSGSSQASFDAITDYSYDVNGNLSLDNNKAISSITYNHLNLPLVITVTGKGTITYTYDAACSKLKKETVDNTVNPAKTTTTIYTGGGVYENDILQFFGHEEGRMRPTLVNGLTTMAFDYFIKDHLGNVRMVLTEEQKTDAYPVASLETVPLSTESIFYGALNDGRVNKSTVSGYPNDTYTNPNDFIQKLRGDAVKTGANMVLKVMAGDKFTLRANSWWKSTATPGTPVSPLNDLINALSNNVAGVSGGKATATELTNTGTSNAAATGFLNSQTYNSARPKAFVNWIFLDEQFKYYAGGFDQVGATDVFTTHSFTNVAINKSGYLYIYVSNETPNIDVFFDNLQVTHTRGPILEETHYYPFGLTMSGISSKALAFGGAENKYKYNGKEEQRKEFSDGSGIDAYDFNARMYDHQIGRFMNSDPHADNYHEISPYNFVNNNPLIYIDPDGKDYAIYFEEDKDGKWSIRITATYYVKKGDKDSKESADQAVKFWNEQSGEFALRVGSKKNHSDYVINFDLKVMEVDDPQAEKEKDFSEKEDRKTKDGSSNTYEVVDDNLLSTDKGGLTTGSNNIKVKRSLKDSRQTPGHEVGHTLLMEDVGVSSSSIMALGTTEVNSVFPGNIQETINAALNRAQTRRITVYGNLPKGKVKNNPNKKEK